MRTAAPAPTAPRWVVVGSLVVCGLGLAVSAYLTFEHYTSSTTLACSGTGAINCLKVTTSSYAKVLGIPVALLGLLFFAAMTALCAPRSWRSTNQQVRRARLAASGVGMLSVLYLIWVELFRVEAICLWCTAVHLLTFALFALVVLESTGALAPPPGAE